MKQLIGVQRRGPAFTTGANMILDAGHNWFGDILLHPDALLVWWAGPTRIMPTLLVQEDQKRPFTALERRVFAAHARQRIARGEQE